MTALRMNLRRYAFVAPFSAIAENLVNSYDVSLAEPEHFTTVAALSAFMVAHDIARPRKATARELMAVRRLRTAVRAVFEAASPASAGERIAAMLAGARLEPVMIASRKGSRLDWSIPVEVGVVLALRSAVAFNLAYLVAERGFDRLRICGAAPCADVFLDVSRPGGQRFCGPRCATRTRVAAYRARGSSPD